MMLPESGTRKGVGRSRSQRKKSEVLCGRSRSGRPYPLRQAPSPQDLPFPLDLYPIARQEGIQPEPGTRKGIGRSRSQRKKGEVLCGRSRSGRPYPLRQAPSPQDFPFPLDFQREKVRSCAVAHAPAARILYGRLHRPSTAGRHPKGKGVVMSHEAG